MLIGAADGDVEHRLLWVACVWFASFEEASTAYQLAHHSRKGVAHIVGATDAPGKARQATVAEAAAAALQLAHHGQGCVGRDVGAGGGSGRARKATVTVHRDGDFGAAVCAQGVKGCDGPTAALRCLSCELAHNSLTCSHFST